MSSLYSFPALRRHCALFAVLAVTIVLVPVTGCSSNSSTTTITAPASLNYPQSSVTVILGQAVATATPSVTGTVTTYSISPALPTGLAFSNATGAISGTPTASSPQATYTITASNAGGSTSTTIQLTVNVPAPTNLIYSPSSITGTVGQSIAAITPTVSGGATSYTVSPALPIGLTLSSSTGSISGLPTTTSAQANYLVTAANASGSTTATVSVAVVAAVTPPSALAYPQPNISVTVGDAIAPDIPSITGNATTFAVSPALPAGVSLNSSNGMITGAPSTQQSKLAYTVTASNGGGSTSTVVTIAAFKPYVTALEVGHSTSVTEMHATANRLLSHDTTGHWVLWDPVKAVNLAHGEQNTPTNVGFPVDIVGNIMVIGQPNGVEIRSAVDGHTLTIIVAPNVLNPPSALVNAWWKLSADGTYICAGSTGGLFVWATNGQLTLTKQGDYSSAKVFTGTTQIQVALGAAGSNVIESIPLNGGPSTVSPTFIGTFHSWFLDGQRFLSRTGSAVWTYSAAGTQQALVSMAGPIVGEGSWILAYGTSSVDVYAIGASTPSASYPFTSTSQVFLSGALIGILPATYSATSTSATIVDLSGSTPTKTDFTLSSGSPLYAFAATSAANWFVAKDSLVVDGTSPNLMRTLNLGRVRNIAGGTTRAAVLTQDGTLSYFSVYQPSPTATIALGVTPGPFISGETKIALSSDDSVLAASNNLGYSQGPSGVNIYSLPSGALTSTISYDVSSGKTLTDFILAASGTVLGQVITPTGSIVTRVGGSTPIWSGTGSFLLSPDGTRIATISGATTSLYNGNQLTGAFPSSAIAWLDNSRLLTPVRIIGAKGLNEYLYSAIYDYLGTQQATSSIPSLTTAQPVGSDQVYSPEMNTIYSLTTGQAVWTATATISPTVGSVSPSTIGAVAGQYVVFSSGTQVLIDSH